MKTLYLHIGTPKTATTSVQNFLEENEDLLEEQGFCYPIFPHKYKRVTIQRNAHFLMGQVLDKNEKRIRSEEKRLFQEGIDFVLDHFKRFDNLFFTDEGIWNTHSKYEERGLMTKLMKEAEEHGFTVKVIVYLRRQDTFANSWWNQKVKAGKRNDSAKSWAEFLEGVPSLYQMDYWGELERLSTFVGKENIIVRRFDRKYLKNGSIYEDFLDALGLELTDRYVITEGERNVGLFGNTHEIKRILNGLPDLRYAENTLFREILAEMSAEDPSLKNQTMFSEEEAEAFMETYREGNRKVMKEYLGMDGDMFDMDFSKNRKWVYNPEEMQRDVIRFTGKVIARVRMENKELSQRVKATEQELKEQRERIEELKKECTKKSRRF